MNENGRNVSGFRLLKKLTAFSRRSKCYNETFIARSWLALTWLQKGGFVMFDAAPVQNAITIHGSNDFAV